MTMVAGDDKHGIPEGEIVYPYIRASPLFKVGIMNRGWADRRRSWAGFEATSRGGKSVFP
jgi:hypothetical protein